MAFTGFDQGNVGNNGAVDNHTAGGTNSQLLRGYAADEAVGLAKSFAVYPGDTINMEVYARYTDNFDNSLSNSVDFGVMFLQAFGIPLTGENAIDPALFGGEAAIATESDDGSSGGAYAYLNYIFYDKNFEDEPEAGFSRTKSNHANAFDTLSLDFVPEKEGYLFVYVSNEEPVARDVYFDDLKIVHKQSIIAQTDSYYPFGLSHSNMSMMREGKKKNQFLYNGKELVEGFDLGWYDYGARYYDPQLNWFFTQDRFVEKYSDNTPYHYALNNPTNYVDINGDSVWVTSTTSVQNFENGTSHTTINHTIHITGKVLDASDAPIDVFNVTSLVNKNLNGVSVSENSGGNGATFTTNISIDADFEAVTSMDQVNASDHLITVVDNIEGHDATGLTYLNGKSAFAQAGLFTSDAEVASTATHELGHNLGLAPGNNHHSDPSNYMSVPLSLNRKNFTFSQLNGVVIDAKNGRLNQGANFSIVGQGTNNILWHRSSNVRPYDFNISSGQKIPKTVQ